MANKKYNEFPVGTYDTTKIFLQADPDTGELEKVNLPEPGIPIPEQEKLNNTAALFNFFNFS